MFCEIRKDGIYASVYNEETETFELHKIDSLAPYMLNEVSHVDHDYTINDLIHHLMEHEKEVNELLSSSMGSCEIRPFYDDLSNVSNDIEDLDNVVFEWVAELWSFNGEEKDYQEWVNVSAIGSEDDNERMSIEFIPLGDIKDLTISLIDDFSLVDVSSSLVEGNSNTYLVKNAKKAFTLRDVLEGFLWEVTFHGPPDSREQRFIEIQREMSKLDSDEVVGYTTDEIELGRETERLKKLEEEEDYETASVVKKNIERLKKEISKKKKTVNNPYEDGDVGFGFGLGDEF